MIYRLVLLLLCDAFDWLSYRLTCCAVTVNCLRVFQMLRVTLCPPATSSWSSGAAMARASRD